MKEFKKLNRDEMKNVKGGAKGTCNQNQACNFWYNATQYYGVCSLNCSCMGLISGNSGCTVS